ncbi:MAG: NAD(P)H-dependent flavin oxidoreductase [Acidimicrobiia bacterium]
MLRTPLCDLVGIDVPVIQAGMSVYTSPRLAAAVSNAGGLGSLGAWNRPVEQLRSDLDALRDSTDRPFAVNHVVPALDPEAFSVTLELAPKVISFALDDAAALMQQVHDAGCLVMQQVTTVQQAEQAVAHGADIIVAQGGEAGGYSGTVAALPLVPQVVDAVTPTPVVAAGGIADGRGVAAALVLGAAGVNIGTRFLASDESPVGEVWKKAILAARSEEWVQLDFLNDLQPTPGTVGYGTRVRARRSEFTDRWQVRRDEIRTDPAPILAEFTSAAAAGTMEELLVVGGQSAGAITVLMSAADIVHTLVTEAEDALARAAGLLN